MAVEYYWSALWPAERRVIECAALGRPTEFDPQSAKPELRADVLGHLLLGHDDAISGSPWRILLPGLRVRHAVIVGALDLHDAARPGEGLPALALDDCDIAAPIRLDAARIARLSIRGSRFSELHLQEAHIDGPFDFSEARAFVSPNGIAWIDARNALINGHVSGNAASLRAPAADSTAAIPGSKRRHALCLMNTEIRGSVQLADGFKAMGGISLDTAHIRGDVVLTGAEVSAGEDDAFSAQNARIGGALKLDEGFTAHGTVWLHSASINEAFVLTRAKLLGGVPAALRGADPALDPAANQRALIADTTDIGGDCWLFRTTAMARVSLRGARIRGSIEAPEFALSGGTEAAFLGDDMEIGNGVSFDDATVTGGISLKGAEIGSSLSLSGAEIGAPSTDFTALNATNAEIGSDATFGRSGEGKNPRYFTSHGRLDLTGLHVRGDLKFSGARIVNLAPNGWLEALSLERSRIDGSLVFGVRGITASLTADAFRAEGEVNLSGASIGRDLVTRIAAFTNPGRSAIYAKDVQVGDDLRLEHTKADGDLRFERAEIAGSLKWDKLTISARRTMAPGMIVPAPLEFRRARVGSALKAERLITVPGSAIDLRGLRVHEVEDWSIDGWGSRYGRRFGPACEIDFDGMVYERISIHDQFEETELRHRWEANGIPFTLPGPRYHPRGGMLLNWILHQRRPLPRPEPGVVLPRHRKDRHDDAVRMTELRETDHFPQPFRQLARVLRNQGEEEAARFISVAERWATPATGMTRAVRRYFFGPFFEFGLSPKRGLITVLLYWGIGTYGVWQAHENHMLVETSMVASTISAPETAEPLPPSRLAHKHAFMAPSPGAADLSELPCTDTATGVGIDFVYSADMIVPFIPLHEETKCEISTEQPYSTEWRIARALYTVIGWLIVSITLATFAGLLKRGAGDGE